MLLGVSTTIARDATTVRGLDASPVAAMAKVVFAVDDQEALSSVAVVVVVVCGIFSPLARSSVRRLSCRDRNLKVNTQKRVQRATPIEPSRLYTEVTFAPWEPKRPLLHANTVRALSRARSRSTRGSRWD